MQSLTLEGCFYILLNGETFSVLKSQFKCALTAEWLRLQFVLSLTHSEQGYVARRGKIIYKLYKQSKLLMHLCTLTHMSDKSWMSMGTLSSLINGPDQKWSSWLLTVARPLECIITLLQMSCPVTMFVFLLTPMLPNCVLLSFS